MNRSYGSVSQTVPVTVIVGCRYDQCTFCSNCFDGTEISRLEKEGKFVQVKGNEKLLEIP